MPRTEGDLPRSLDSVVEHLDQCVALQSESSAKASSVVSQLIGHIQECKKLLTAVKKNDSPRSSRKRKVQAVVDLNVATHKNDPLTTVRNEHRKLNSHFSKLGSLIDDTLKRDLTWTRDSSSTEPLLMIEPILQHLATSGDLDAAHHLAAESSCKKFKFDVYARLHGFLEEMSNDSFENATRWLEENKVEEHTELHNRLLFELSRAQFATLLSVSNAAAAVEFARVKLAPFQESHSKEIQELMGALVLKRDNEPSLNLKGELLKPLQNMFTQYFCLVEGVLQESSLQTCLRAGEIAIPRLAKFFEVFNEQAGGKQKEDGVADDKEEKGWKKLKELPVQVALEKDLIFHSTFTCPVSREQTSETNPPMLLVCGHVIAKASAEKLAKSGSIKCPTCPVEARLKYCKQLYF